MKLYHLSKEKLASLAPTVGSDRHGGEDPRAVGKAVVWLSNEQAMSRTDSDGNVDPYQHEVDIAIGDPDLLMDEPFDKLMKDSDQMFGGVSTLRWFFYLKPVEVDVVRTWDPKQKKYV